MSKTEREKMAAGDWYTCINPELEEMRITARNAVHEHNTLPPAHRGNIGPQLKTLMRTVAADTWIETPFHCAYGFNISLADGVYINAGCVFLDTAPLTIGSDTMLGPAVQIYCAQHHQDAEKRTAGLEVALPVTIGRRVWIGGGAIILPGVEIADDSIVGAGSVVVKNVPAGARIAGNPARPLAKPVR